MVTQIVYLKDYDWLIKVFYEVTSDDTDIILKELDDIDCPAEIYYSAAEMLEGDYPDTGFTYTSSFYQISFIIMMQSSCADEFQNTFDHEKDTLHIIQPVSLVQIKQVKKYNICKVRQAKKCSRWPNDLCVTTVE